MKSILSPRLTREFQKLALYIETLLLEFENYRDTGDSTDRRICAVSSRIKTDQSITLKLSRLQISNPLLLPDIAGVRAVCYTLNGVSEVAAFIDSLDRTRKIRIVGAKDNSDIPRLGSGYRGYHLVVQAGADANVGLNKTIRCEIQILTILQDAWAALSRRYASPHSSHTSDEANSYWRHLSEVLHELDLEIKRRELS